MRNLIASWQTPLTYLLLLALGLFAVDGNEILVDGIVFILAMYAFTAGTRTHNTPDKTVSKVATFAALGLGFLISVDVCPEMGYFESIPFAILFTSAYFTAAGSREMAHRAIKLAVTSGALVGLVALYKGALPHDYIKWPFLDSNLFAGLMLAALFPSVGFTWQAFKENKRRVALGWAIVALCLGVAGVATHSRGAWLSAIAALAVGCYSFRAALTISRAKIAGMLVVVLLIALPGIIAKTASDLSQHNGAGASVHSRIALLTSTVHMIKDHPLKGSGWGTWFAEYRKYRTAADVESTGIRAHCDYLEAWASGGVVGLLEMLSLPLLLILGLRKLSARGSKLTPSDIGISIGASVLVIQAAVNFIFHQDGVAALAGVLIGAMYAENRADEAPRSGRLTILWQAFGVLALLSTMYLAAMSYFAQVPSDIMLNPLGRQSLLFGRYMNEKDLTLLSRLDPMSAIPDFAIANDFTTKGVLEKHDEKLRKALFDKAIEYYEKAAKRDPLSSSTRYREGLIYASVYPGLSSEERYRRTMNALGASLDINPQYPASLGAYVQFADMFGHFEDARQRVKTALAGASVYNKQQIERLLQTIDEEESKHAASNEK